MSELTEFEVGKIELPEAPQVLMPEVCLVLTTEGKIKWLIHNLDITCTTFMKDIKKCKEDLLFIKIRIEQLKDEEKKDEQF